MSFKSFDFSVMFSIWKPYLMAFLYLVLFIIISFVCFILWFFIKYHTLNPDKLEKLQIKKTL